ncbi:MAG: hypothetical protein ACHQAX_02525 [Gammaproteobacteria bacterium]
MFSVEGDKERFLEQIRFVDSAVSFFTKVSWYDYDRKKWMEAFRSKLGETNFNFRDNKDPNSYRFKLSNEIRCGTLSLKDYEYPFLIKMAIDCGVAKDKLATLFTYNGATSNAEQYDLIVFIFKFAERIQKELNLYPIPCLITHRQEDIINFLKKIKEQLATLQSQLEDINKYINGPAPLRYEGTLGTAKWGIDRVGGPCHAFSYAAGVSMFVSGCAILKSSETREIGLILLSIGFTVLFYSIADARSKREVSNNSISNALQYSKINKLIQFDASNQSPRVR